MVYMSLDPQKICLNMIVKNESHVIESTLANILEHVPITTWVIADTGSTDNTKEIIRTFFENRQIPGQLLEHEWVNFAHNRNLAIQAVTDADYVFIFDADDRIYGHPIFPPALTHDQYTFYFGKDHGYTRPLLVNARKKWLWKGVLHECLCAQEETTPSAKIQGDYYVESGRTGARSQNPMKYLEDAKVLEKGFEYEFTRDRSMADRYAFYCGQSYKDQGPEYHDKAIEWYEKCLLLNNWVQEKYVACIYLGDMYKNKKDHAAALKYWCKSTEYDAERTECIANAMTMLREDGNHILVNALYHRFKDYNRDPKGKLFLQVHQVQNYTIEYNNSISAYYANDKKTGYESCKRILENLATLPEHIRESTMSNMPFYLPSPDQPQPLLLDLFYEFDQAIHTNKLYTKHAYKLWNELFDRVKPELTAPAPAPPPAPTENPKILISFTTCKRWDLFQQTMNSLLRHCTDISMVDYWYCVDDNSTEEDREQMRTTYPWLHYVWKTPTEKGHRQSMNLIYNKLAELKPTLWIHMEDDFLFHAKLPYITMSIEGLIDLSEQNVRQIVWNRNYAETIECYSTAGHAPSIDPNLALHVHHTQSAPYVNCHYWPHYSFRPSMIDVSTILELGNFDSPNQFFEMDYAKRWTEAGYTTAFLNRITHRHIGRLTKDRGNKDAINAYSLNNESQFTATIDPGTTVDVSRKPENFMGGVKGNTCKIINLERRPDRKERMIKTFAEASIDSASYEFIKATDGKVLKPTFGLAKLFQGNDFGSRRGVLGCALTHFELWMRLLVDPDHSYYVIMEDDITLCPNFSARFQSLVPHFQTKDTVFLGYSMFEAKRNTCRALYENDNPSVTIHKLNQDLYIGGYFAYSIHKTGAKKLVDYINKNGIKHGIDYLNKILPELDSYESRPQLVFTAWNEGGKKIDTDIQNNSDSIDLSNVQPPSPRHGNVCFIHCCTIPTANEQNSGPAVARRILDLIKSTGLWNILDQIYLCNIGDPIDATVFSTFGEKITIRNLSPDTQTFEFLTINAIHEYSIENDNTNILYLHTKGITHTNPEISACVMDWTNMMLYFLVEKHKTCIEKLKTHDAVGCNVQIRPHKHFSGNFWWATTKYIRRLAPIPTNSPRHDAEWWVLTPTQVVVYSMHDSTVDHYHTRYPKDRYHSYKLQLLCNWTATPEKEWSNMCESAYRWKDIEFTTDPRAADYSVIINKPPSNAIYDPKRTIVFQMEPWVQDPAANWGVKTWGQWANPDPTKFLAVRGRKTPHHNNAFWQLEQTEPQLRYQSPEKTKGNAIASICSSKYFDPGHIVRIDFLKFLEAKQALPLDIYNYDNPHGFQNYRGTATPYVDKSKGIAPYKYYFMVENNYEPNFITEKLWEPILCETLTFYYGCPNVADHVDPRAYVLLDMNDFEGSYQIMIRAINEDWHMQRLPYIREAKQKILDDLAFFPTVKKIIDEYELKH